MPIGDAQHLKQRSFMLLLKDIARLCKHDEWLAVVDKTGSEPDALDLKPAHYEDVIK